MPRKRVGWLIAAGLMFLLATATSAQTVSFQRGLSVTHLADVVVIGGAEGGLGGCFAAIAAARDGADVLFLESGGNLQLHTPISLGVVIGIHGWRPSMNEGLFKEFARAVAQEGQHSDPPITLDQLMEKGELIVRYHDIVTTALLRMMRDAKVRMLFHTRVCDTIVEDKTIRDLVVVSPQGMHAIRGKVYVDSTGLADVAAMAGVPLKTEEGFQGLQAFIANVDDAKFNKWANDPSQKPLGEDEQKWLESIVGPFDKLQFPWDQWWPEFLGKRFGPAFVRKAREAVEKGDLTLIRRHGEKAILAIPEGVKVDRHIARPRTYITGIDPTNADDLSWAEVESRLALTEYLRFLKKYIPGFENAVMDRIAESIGYRGGRYIDVPNPITPEDVQKGGIPEDVIFLLQRGPDHAIYGVPFRALVPQKIDNLLVVGKSTAGGTHLRTANAVLFQGEAAGIAASESIREKVPVGKVDIHRVQAALRKSGVVLDAPTTQRAP
jgi:hypothetical protein